jgi:hypothetical protein
VINILFFSCLLIKIGQRKAVRVEEEMRCGICSTPVLGSRSNTGLIVFFCHHAFHSKCLRQDIEEGGQS